MWPDYHVHLMSSLFICEGNRAAEFTTVVAMHNSELFGLPPTGERIEYDAVRLYTFRDGLIADERRIYNLAGVLERLGKARLDREMTVAGDIHFRKVVDKATPNLFRACAEGDHKKTATLSSRRATGKGGQEVYLKIDLTDVFISAHNILAHGGTDVIPFEEFTLNFASMKIAYKEQKADGSHAGDIVQGWNYAERKSL